MVFEDYDILCRIWAHVSGLTLIIFRKIHLMLRNVVRMKTSAPESSEFPDMDYNFSFDSISVHNPHLSSVPQSTAGPYPLETGLITSNMSSECVATYLGQHHCKNVTDSLDLQRCSPCAFTRGGLGAIYQGVLRDGRPVAIKCIEPLIGPDINLADCGKNFKRAAREIYTWSHCNHEGVLPMLGFAHFRGQIALITPWMEAGSLKQQMLRGSSPPPLQTCLQLANTVEYLHGAGIVHGDIKPDNILVTDQGRIQLADFGSAMLTLASTLNFTRTSSFKFSTRFAAPEVLKEESCIFTEESDIYALGMTMLNIMSGQTPFADKVEACVIIEVIQNKGQPSRPNFGRNLRGDVTKDNMWDLLKWCFTYEPAARPKASQVKEALIEIERLDEMLGGEAREVPSQAK